MKREIKFRAWNSARKEMYLNCGFHPHLLQDISYEDEYYKENLEGRYIVHEDDVIKLMQYTGLKDKNGKEIYEGDICKNYNETLFTLKEDTRLYQVKWQEGEFGMTYNKEWLKVKPSFVFEKINPKGENYMSLIFSQQQIEVIGNIYENPELIK